MQVIIFVKIFLLNLILGGQVFQLTNYEKQMLIQSMKSAKESLVLLQDSEVDNIHEFSLKPLNDKASISQVVVDFTPQISESQLVSITPKLIRSSDCYQPLFQLPFFHRLLNLNKDIPQLFQSMKQGPSRTPISQKSSTSKIQSSKPKPTSKYCQLCKQKFNEDYLDVDLYLIKHIKHIAHLNNLKTNPFQKYIQSLVQDFKKSQTLKRALDVTVQDQSSSDHWEKQEMPVTKSKKKVKQENDYSRNDKLNIDFPYKQVNSTESTNNGSAIDQTQKKQPLNSFKE